MHKNNDDKTAFAAKRKKKLSVLASCSEDGGFAKSLFDTINTLKSACITPENLRTAAEKAEKPRTS